MSSIETKRQVRLVIRESAGIIGMTKTFVSREDSVSQAVHLFSRVLLAEIEDMLEDIESIELRLKERLAKREVTSFVYKENETFFHAEEHALKDLLEYVESGALLDSPSIDDAVVRVERKTREIVKNRQNVEALYGCVTRKINKVMNYVGREPA